MGKFSLVGVNGNAFAVMGYTARALRRAGLEDQVDKMYEEAESGNYYHLITTCEGYINKANKALEGKKMARGRKGIKVAVHTVGGKPTKLEFPSLTKCAGELGLQPSHVSEVMNGKRPQHKGYTFRRI